MKGQPWCSAIPVVTVPQGEPKHLTYVLPYYQNPQFLRQQLAWWRTYPAHLRARLTAIIVDDGSPTAPAADVLAGADLPFPVRLFRIEQDVRWNWLAARNIGFHYVRHESSTSWVLVTDMDHVVPETTAAAVIYGQHDFGTIYGFSRIEHTGEALAPHPNSWLLTRAMFWTIGGYDEALSGHYGTDGDWRRRCAASAPMAILSDRLIRHEYQGDSSTTRYLRKQPEDAAVRRIIDARPSKGWRPKTLSFPHHEVEIGVTTCQ
jgi:hypothetical protein